MQYLVSDEQMKVKVQAYLKKGHKHLKINDFDTLRNRWTRKAGVTGWNTKRFDTFMAELVDKGAIKLATGCKLGGERERAHTIHITRENPAIAERANMVRKVEKWITKRATEGVVTHTMCNMMKANLTPKGAQKKGVMAAIIMVCYDLNLNIESRTGAEGGQGKTTNTKKHRNYLKDVLQWALDKGWIGEENRQRMYDTMNQITRWITQMNADDGMDEEVAIDLGCGWGGVTQGMRKEFGRVIGMDIKMQTIRRGQLKAVDILDSFQNKRDYKGGLIKFIEDIGGIKARRLAAIWGSPCCKKESKANRQNKNKPYAQGPHCGQKRPRWEQAGIDTLREGVQQAQKRNKKVQHCMENPAETALTTDKEWMKFFGKGMVVPACPYGRKSSKKYHLWMSPATEREFRKVMIHPTDKESLCKECKKGEKLHQQAQCKRTGDTRPGVSEAGFGNDAANNRVPWRLAQLISKCMKKAYRSG